MPHQPTYSEVTHGFTNDEFVLAGGTYGSPYNALNTPLRYVAAETRNFYCGNLTLLNTHAQAFGLLLPYDVAEAEFYFYSFAAYAAAPVNFIPFVSVAGPSLAPDTAVVPLQTVLPSFARSIAGMTQSHGSGVLQGSAAIAGLLADASSLLFGVICVNQSGGTLGTQVRLSMDTRRFDEPRYVTEAR